MTQRTEIRKLLVLRGPAIEAAGLLDLLKSHFDVEVVSEFDDAMSGMQAGRFDAVVAETADFLPLERGLVTQKAELVLDTLGEGVCIVGPKGEMVWANQRLRGLRPEVLDSLRRLCFQAYEEFATTGRSGQQRGRRFSLMPDHSTYYEVICSPVCDRQGVLRQVVAVVMDATNQRKQQLKLNAIDRAGRELVRLEDEPRSERDVHERLKVLVERIIRYSRDVLDYQHFTVLLLHELSNRLEVMVAEGLGDKLEGRELFANAEGNGICGYVAATGRSYICPDVRGDPRYVQGLHNARSSLTVPLRLHDRVVGVLNVESDRVGAFGEEDRQFAEIFGNYVAVALHILNLLVVERHATHTQVSGSICAELAGPLNDIVTEATELMEDYIGLDDLRKRLNQIIDRASQARRTMQQISEAPKTGVLGAPSAPRTHADPILNRKKILIADDEELIRQTIGDVLGSYGCDVELACNGPEACAKASTGGFDLVISDIKMPGASGYDVFAAAKAANSDTKVILMTAFGYDPGHAIVRANREGLSAVLMKPFKVNQLLDECRDALTK